MKHMYFPDDMIQLYYSTVSSRLVSFETEFRVGNRISHCGSAPCALVKTW